MRHYFPFVDVMVSFSPGQILKVKEAWEYKEDKCHVPGRSPGAAATGHTTRIVYNFSQLKLLNNLRRYIK